MLDSQFWSQQKVLITGHTGFKGGWLAHWLSGMGAEIAGVALPPDHSPSLFDAARIGEKVESHIGDIAIPSTVDTVIDSFRPDIIFHLAAQPLVRYSYAEPVETYRTNLMGAVNVLESTRNAGTVKAVVVITSDKCYENKEWVWGYRETDEVGGSDPYSSSKGCVELITSSYRRSYFSAETYKEHGTAVASVRAGNVIGGGNWSEDRLLPDIIRAFENNEPVEIRSPNATRPWQHVLEPLSGYALLAEKLVTSEGRYAEGWNFGPDEHNNKSVGWIVKKAAELWGEDAQWRITGSENQPHEATLLQLDCSKAKTWLGWYPVWSIEESVSRVIEWHKASNSGEDMAAYMNAEIAAYIEAAG